MRKGYTPANILTSYQHCVNVVDQRWNNINPMLKMKQNLTSDFQRCMTLIQCRCLTLKQHWNNVDTTLSWRYFNVASTLLKAISKPVGLVCISKKISFILLNIFFQYINNSTTDKLVKSYSNFHVVLYWIILNSSSYWIKWWKWWKFQNLKTLKNPETLLRSLKFVIHQNLESDAIKISKLVRNWSVSTQMTYSNRNVAKTRIDNVIFGPYFTRVFPKDQKISSKPA